MLSQGTLAWESHHLQHAESSPDERLPAARQQAPPRPGATWLQDVGARTVAAAEHGIAASPFAESVAR